MRRVLLACAGVGVLLLIACGAEDVRTPTPSPATAAAATPTIDVEAVAEVAYLAELMIWFTEGLALSEAVGEIARSPAPFSASNEARALTLSLDADTWRDGAVSFAAPARFASVHVWVERAGVTMADALNDFWLGIRFVDIELIDSATAKMETSSDYIDNANDALAAVD